MRLPTRTGFVLAVAAVIAALPTAAGALPSGTQASSYVAANSATFQDSTGEDPLAPDITSLTVSNDDAGIVSFRINVPNRPTLGQDMLIVLFVDTDANDATGSQDLPGVDYVIEVARGEANLFKWDGTDFTRRFGDPSALTLSFSYQAGVTIRISAAELGNTTKLEFLTFVESGIVVDPITGNFDFTNAKADVAPGGGVGLYPFTVIIAKPTLVVRGVTTTPRAPKAGATFTMRMTAARSDTGAVLQNGRVTCVGRAGTARLRAQLARVQGGAVTCTWLIPANAKGKTFRGSATVVFEGLRASRSISRRIG
ncbi:MAG: hypothetical protein M3364_06415 [Actinomycetota bacterium]|nr:hypothetical protein [Actinomycetota bacterium]